MSWLLFLGMAMTAQEDALKVTATPDKKECLLGEEVQLEIKLENTGEKELVVSELQFEKRSVSFEIMLPGGVKFWWWVLRPDPHVADRLPLPRVTLAKGQTMISQYRIPALLTGEMEIVAKYNGGEKEIKAAPVKVTVNKTERGTKLSAILTTKKGEDIILDLFPEEAPVNVMNFVSLVRLQFYDGMIFHRVIKNNWIQTGCPYGIGVGGPGYAVPSEAKGTDGKPQRTLHEPGTVSMCGYEKTDYNGSQFFLCLGKIPALNGKYTVIGKVTEQKSLDALQQLGRVETERNTDRPKSEDLEIKKITIVVR